MRSHIWCISVYIDANIYAICMYHWSWIDAFDRWKKRENNNAGEAKKKRRRTLMEIDIFAYPFKNANVIKHSNFKCNKKLFHAEPCECEPWQILQTDIKCHIQCCHSLLHFSKSWIVDFVSSKMKIFHRA